MTTWRVIDNDDDRFPGHALIEQTEDDGTVIRSWAPDEIPIESRLNINHPEVEDRRTGAPKRQRIRWAMPSAEVHALLHNVPDADGHREELRKAAKALGLDVTVEALPRHGVKPGAATPRRSA